MPVDARYSGADEITKPDGNGRILVVAVPWIAERDLSVAAGSGDFLDHIWLFTDEGVEVVGASLPG